MRGMSVVVLLLSLVMGGFIAYYNNSWWTFFGSTIGLLSYWSYEGFVLWILQKRYFSNSNFIFLTSKFRRKIFKLTKRLAYLTANLFVFDEKYKIEGYVTQLRILALARYSWVILSQEYLSIKNRLLMSGIAGSPIFYIRWLIIGLVVTQISTSISLHSVSLKLDIFLGLLVAITFLKEMLSDTEREALLEAQTAIPIDLASKIYELESNSNTLGLNNGAELFHLREAVRKKGSLISEFVKNSWTVLINTYGLLIVFFVLFVISFPGALLALISAMVVLPTMIFGSFISEVKGKSIGLIKVRRSSLAVYLEDSRLNASLRRVAPFGAIVDQVNQLGDQLTYTLKTSRDDHRLIRLIARLVFFTLFALSILFPIVSIQAGYMSTRVVILYTFSMMSLWYAIGNIAYRSSQLVKVIFDLEEVEEAIALIKRDGKNQNNTSLQVVPCTSNEVSVGEFSFGYPWQELILKNKTPFVISATISTANVVRVLGNKQTIFLELISGSLSPTFGCIKFSETNLPVSDYNSQVLYIPDKIPNFDNGRILEIFQAFLSNNLNAICSPSNAGGLLDQDVQTVEEILDKFGLLKQIKFKGKEEYTGANLILGRYGNYLDDNQNRLLFFALNYAAIKCRLLLPTFKPLMIVLDGLPRLSLLESRQRIAKLFCDLADEAHATLVIAAKDGREVGGLRGDDEFVIRCVDKQDLPEQLITAGEDISLIAFGRHGEMREHIDKKKRESYLAFLNAMHERQ